MVLGTIFFVPTHEKKETSVPRLVPQMFALFVAKVESGNITIQSSGTGMLIDQERGHIATAKHVLADSENNHGYVLYAMIDGSFYPLEVVWKHHVGDIAVVRFQEGRSPTTLPHALSVAKMPPIVGESVKFFGYLPQAGRSKLRACEVRKPGFFCERAFTLTINLVDVPAEEISLQMAIDEWREFVDTAAEHLDTLPNRKDFFFAHYLAGQLSDQDQERDFHGMSGGGLVNSRGDIIGLTVAHYDKRIVFVPANEIPDEYLPRSFR